MAEELLDLGALDVEQRAYDPLARGRQDTGKPRRAGPAQQSKQHRLGLVRARVSGRDPLDCARIDHLPEKGRASAAGVLFQIALARNGRAAAYDCESETRRQTADELGIAAGLGAPELMVEVQNREA